MQLTFDYEELNRIVQLHACKQLGLTPVSDIEVTVVDEPYGQNVLVTLGVYHSTDDIEDCE